MSSDVHPPAVPFGIKAARARKMLNKNLNLLRDLVTNLEPWQGQGSLRRNVAARMFGAPAEVRPTATIGEGRDNLSLTILAAQPVNGGRRRLVLEKKTHNSSDYRVARQLAGHGTFTLLPEVYAANARPSGFLIYTDYLEELEQFVPDRDGDRTLAEAAVQLSKDLARFPDLAERQPYFEYGWKGFHHHLIGECGLSPESIQQVLLAAGKLPLAMCHNDLSPGNIHLRERGGARTVAFVDMGSIKANFAGAELHPFAAAADLGGDADFLRSVAREYSVLSGVAEHDVLFAAHLYASSVALRNSINKLRADPYSKPATHFLSALRHLPH